MEPQPGPSHHSNDIVFEPQPGPSNESHLNRTDSISPVLPTAENAQIVSSQDSIHAVVPSASMVISVSSPGVPSIGTTLQSTPRAETAPRKPSYGNWKFEPFQHHLTISDDSIVARKRTQIKSKVPPAISGNEYHAMLINKQQQKAKELEEKEKRKLEREKKKARKRRKNI